MSETGPDFVARLLVHAHDSPLGSWRLALLQPPPELADAIEFCWHVDGSDAGEVTRILPRGNSHLMFNLGADQRVLDLHGVRDPQVHRHAWFSGQQQRFLDIDSTGPSCLTGVRLRTLGAWRVLGLPQHALADQVLDLDAVLGDSMLALRQRLLDATAPETRLALFEHWLLERVRRQPPAHYAVRWAERRLRETGGGIEIAELAGELGYSRKHLVSLFQREVGLTPKALARVLRFSQALGRLRECDAPRWDELALECGYYDQSHLIREFQSFAGHAPTSFLRQASLDDESIRQDRPSAGS